MNTSYPEGLSTNVRENIGSFVEAVKNAFGVDLKAVVLYGSAAEGGVASAAAIVSVTEDDVMNLGIGLHAKKLNPGVRTVVRTFDAMLGSKLQDQLGINRVLSVSAVSAPTFAGSVLCRNLIRGSLWQNNLLLVSSDTCGLEISRPGQLSVTLRLSSNMLGLERAADQTPSDGSPGPMPFYKLDPVRALSTVQ